MTRFRMPRYEGSNLDQIAELHDHAMDRLVRKYRSRMPTTRPVRPVDGINDPAEGDGPDRNDTTDVAHGIGRKVSLPDTAGRDRNTTEEFK